MYKQPQIYLLTSMMLRDENYFKKNIIDNLSNNYYWSEDWSAEFYMELAKKGFISTSYDTKGGLVLLPELQYEYAILDFNELHISRKVKTLLQKNNYIFHRDTHFEEIMIAITLAHKDNWLKGEYSELMKQLYSADAKSGFKLTCFSITDKETQKLIAGEIGYIIGETYTSLSGFSSREKQYNNYGTLQLVLLGKYLEKNNFAFWNLGHPHMEYKKKLGAKIYTRSEFLARWQGASLLPIINPA